MSSANDRYGPAGLHLWTLAVAMCREYLTQCSPVWTGRELDDASSSGEVRRWDVPEIARSITDIAADQADIDGDHDHADYLRQHMPWILDASGIVWAMVREDIHRADSDAHEMACADYWRGP